MKNIFKKSLVALLVFLFTFGIVQAAINIVPNGGTGVGTITGIIEGNGTSPFTPVTVGTGLDLTGGTLSGTGGTLTSLTGFDSVLTSPGTITTTGTIGLVNDTATPGALQEYSTNSSGVRGWFPIPAIPSGADFLIGRTAGIVSNPTPPLTDDATWLGYNINDSGASTNATTFIGTSAGNGASAADSSTFIGNSAGGNSTDATLSEFLGQEAGANAASAANSLFLGWRAGFNDTVDNTTGDNHSILIGDNTSTGGNLNSIAIGTSATNTAANQFIIGSGDFPITDFRLVSDSSNDSFLNFNNSVLTLTDAVQNTFINSDNTNVTTATGNVGIGTVGTGTNALEELSTGVNNVAIGLSSGSSLVDGSYNVMIGSAATAGTSLNNTIALGKSSVTTVDDSFVIGGTAGDAITTITDAGYPNTRDDGGTPINYLGTDASGNFISEPLSSLPTGDITGSGTAGQVTYWDGVNSITGDANFLWDAADRDFAVGDPTSANNATYLLVNDNADDIELNNPNGAITIGDAQGGLNEFFVNSPIGFSDILATSETLIADGNGSGGGMDLNYGTGIFKTGNYQVSNGIESIYDENNNLFQIDLAGAGVENFVVDPTTGTYSIGDPAGLDFSLNRSTSTASLSSVYANTRDDSGTFLATSFLYPDASGDILNEPITDLFAGGNFLVGETSGIVSNPATIPGGTEVWLGHLAGTNSASLTNTTLIGYDSGDAASAANNLTALGTAAGQSATNAFGSTFLGSGSGENATNLADSICIGNGSCGTGTEANNTFGGTNIVIGSEASTGGFRNSLVFGESASNTKTNQVFFGSTYTDLDFSGLDYVMPTSQSAGTVLSNDGSGNLSWSPVGSASVSGDVTGRAAAVSSITTLTAPNDGNKHTYSVGGYLNITAVTLDVVKVQVTYTDENGTSQTEDFFPTGLTSPSLATIGNFPLQTANIRVNPNTAVTIKSVLTTGTGSIAYDAGGTLTLLN